MRLYSDDIGLFNWSYNIESKVMVKEYQFKWLCSELKSNLKLIK